MTVIHAQIERSLASILADMGLGTVPARLVACPRPELGDAAVQAALAGARILKRPPISIAQDIAVALSGTPCVASAEAVVPGYVNVRFADGAIAEALAAQSADPHGGIAQAELPQRVVIDFGGPNMAKPLHVGHLRSLVIGESLRRILSAQGHKVVSDIHLGDWGLQMGMLLSEARIRRPNLACFSGTGEPGTVEDPPFSVTDLEEMYKSASAACKQDPARLAAARADTASLQSGDPGLTALWRSMREVSLNSIRDDISLLGAHFDLWDGESDVQPLIGPLVQDLRDRGIATESDGAVVAFVGREGDTREMPPVILLKGDGAALYATTDLATLQDRVTRLGATRIVYCADNRQALHFEGVFRVARSAGYAHEDVALDFVGFGTVNGPDGRPFKTRDGGVMRLGYLLGEALAASRERANASEHAAGSSTADMEALAVATAIGAVKFADLSTHRLTGYVFDTERLLATDGATGPYLQYACARVASVLVKAQSVGLVPSNGYMPIEREERDLALACLGLPGAVAEASLSCTPHVVAEQSFRIAQAFSRFYAVCPVVSADDRQVAGRRLALAQAAYAAISGALKLLGIDVPEQM